MTTLTFCIKDCFSESDPVFNDISDAVLQHAGKNIRYNFVIKVSYNHGGVIVVMRNLVQLIETTVQTYANIYFDLRFGGFAVSAAAFFFLYFAYYSQLPRVRVSSGVRLCLVYHKPRTEWEKNNQKRLIFANQQKDFNLLTAREKQDLKNYTTEFDMVLDNFIKILEDQNGTAVDQHLKDSYNTNGDMSFTLSPKTFKTF